jgi:prophage regulatory protein
VAMRVIRFNEAAKRAGLGRSTVWAKVKKGEFPKPIRLTARTVGFDEAELDAFLESRKAEPYQPADMRQQVEAKAARRAASRQGEAA